MAGFNTAVTGLKAASTDLDVIGNNIANSSTVGFKTSRTEFGDIYATAVVGAGSSNVAGSGVTVSDIAQDFQAGTIEFTNNNLDLAINGSGFFQLDDGQGGTTFTRAGAFQLDKDGFIVSKSGKFLQGYGLDDQGNRLPIGNLAVSQKESPPKATEDIDLSFNIDSREDPTTLTFPYDKDTPASFTYSTTVRTFDSLGNEHTIKYNMVERRPTKDVYSVTTASTAVRISGVTVDPTDGFSAAEIASIEAADSRIDGATLSYSGGVMSFEIKAKYSDYGDVVIEDVSGTPTDITPAPTERDANEVRLYDLAVPSAAQSPATIDVSGVSIVVTDSMSELDMANTIQAREQEILDRNPAIESVSVIDAGSGNYQISIRFKAEQGNINPTSYPISITPTGYTGMSLNSTVDGDNGFQGMYRLYAYLNGTELLDIGKVEDPGEPGAPAGNTEVGPILLEFNPSSGLLRGINDVTFTSGATAPSITVSGADPANNATTITLDLTGTTQFASASIVKSSTQDGYTKGDLIGVSFSETGEMVASFSNGQNQDLGVVAIATFENQSGLQPSGDTEWTATLTSGDAIVNPPGTGLNGTLRSAALEQSNVDLSAELVALIEAQRNFQANSKTIETQNTVTQAILQI